MAQSLQSVGALGERTPDPPALPFPAVPENIEKLKNFIINHYSTSTMNLCPHQKLSQCDDPPLHFTLKPGAVPHAVYTPATIPVHRGEVVKAQINRDVELGILTPVPPMNQQSGNTGWSW